MFRPARPSSGVYIYYFLQNVLLLEVCNNIDVIKCIYYMQVLVAWFIRDNLILRGFGPYKIIFMNVCVVITVAMVMLLRDFGSYGIIFVTTGSLSHGLLCRITCTSIKCSTVITSI
jgi:hypothetical protein